MGEVKRDIDVRVMGWVRRSGGDGGDEDSG